MKFLFLRVFLIIKIFNFLKKAPDLDLRNISNPLKMSLPFIVIFFMGDYLSMRLVTLRYITNLEILEN
jgi:hypothetical protein